MGMPGQQRDVSDAITLYTAFIADAASTSTRRQTVNNIYIGVNGLFLTGLGFLLVNSRLDSWWVVAATAAIALTVTPLNAAWLRTLQYYEHLLNTRYTTMQDIETHHQFSERLFGSESAALPRGPLIGQAIMTGSSLPPVAKKQDRLSVGLATSSTLEISLPRYFLGLYPIIALGTAILVFIITQHIIPPITL